MCLAIEVGRVQGSPSRLLREQRGENLLSSSAHRQMAVIPLIEGFVAADRSVEATRFWLMRVGYLMSSFVIALRER
jgi:hypothetical protein